MAGFCVFLFSGSVMLDKDGDQWGISLDSSVTKANLAYCSKDIFLESKRGFLLCKVRTMTTPMTHRNNKR